MRNRFLNFRKQRIKFLILAVVLVSVIVGSVVYLPQLEQRNHEYKFLFAWGSQGSGKGQFNYPLSVAVDSSGNVYVADSMNHRVQKFTSDGKYISELGEPGYQFIQPLSVAVGSSGNVYVLCVWQNRGAIEKFDSNGTYVTHWDTGNGLGQFPTGVAVDSSDNVYVADFWNNRVEKFTSSGTFIKQWGSYGAGPSQFNNPAGVAVDSSGNVYVTDYGNNRVEKFDSSGTYITQCGSKGSGNGQFGDYGPNSVAVDSSGNVYATDWNNYRVEKFGSVTTIPVDQAMLFIAIAIIVGSVGVYLTMRKRPRNLQRMKE